MTQKQQVLTYLKKGKKITSWQAIQNWHITRLAAIIGFLEKDGHKFDRKTIVSNGTHFTQYKLKKCA